MDHGRSMENDIDMLVPQLLEVCSTESCEQDKLLALNLLL